MSTAKRAQNVASGRMAEDGTRVLELVPAPAPEPGDAVAEPESVAVTAEQEV